MQPLKNIHASRFGFPSGLLLASLLAAPAHAAGLPDTGQDQCDDGTHVLVACSNANTGDAAAYPRQDGRFGRDAQAAAGTLIKTGAGAAGFDYTKVANNGSDLAAGAAQGAGATDWACTRDNVTGLTWEVKNTVHGDLHDSANIFTWYSTDAATNGGNVGDPGTVSIVDPIHPDTCQGTLGGNCNTQAFKAAVNAAALCTYADWRLPTQRELLTLVDAGTLNPSIAPIYFPNTVSGIHWSAATYVPNATFAWGVDFTGGFTNASAKTNTYRARLVRGTPF